MSFFKELKAKSDEAGVAGVEYALLVTVVALAGSSAIMMLDHKTEETFESLGVVEEADEDSGDSPTLVLGDPISPDESEDDSDSDPEPSDDTEDAEDDTSDDPSETEPEENSPPNTSFTVSCTDVSCSFDGTESSDADGTISSYVWDFGDGNTGSGANVAHTYEAGGTYTVTLTITDDDGDTDSSSQYASVTEPSSGPTLSGSSINNGPKWTAVVTITGPAGTYTGTWGNNDSQATCVIEENGGSCEISQSNIHKKVSSVSFETTTGDSVTVSKP